MIDYGLLLLVGLAVWRITSLLVNERGPFDLMGRFRDAMGVHYDALSRCIDQKFYVLCCTWCTSVWVAIFGAAWYVWRTQIDIGTGVVVWLALSTIAIVIDGAVKHDR